MLMETALMQSDKGRGAMDLMKQMDTIYREMIPDEIPWNRTEPPDILVEKFGARKVPTGLSRRS
jgi:hypothetical protein